MAVIDTTLDFFKIPGIDTFVHAFGTKKPNGKGLTTEEVANNIAAGFMRQRPYVVTETSNTQRIDANSIFLITANAPASPIVLTLGGGAFIGCEVTVINKSDVQHNLNAAYSGSALGTVTLPAKSKMSLIWAGDGWIILDSQKINNNEFASALSPKDLPSVEAMNFGENSGYIKWTNGILLQFGAFYLGATIGTLTLPLAFSAWNSYALVTGEVQHTNDSNDTEGYNYVSGVNKRTANTVEFSVANRDREIHWFTIGY